MTLIKLEQLTLANNIISDDLQKEIRGGANGGGHTTRPTPTRLWNQYADGNYDIKPSKSEDSTIIFSPTPTNTSRNNANYSLNSEGQIDILYKNNDDDN
jgi:hypothetical protein